MRKNSLLISLKSIVPFLFVRADAQQIHQTLIIQSLHRRKYLFISTLASWLAWLLLRLFFLFPLADLLLVAPFFDSCFLGGAHLVVNEAVDGEALLVLLLDVVIESIVLDDLEGHEAE